MGRVQVIGQRPNDPETTHSGALDPDTVAASIGGVPNSAVAPGKNHQVARFNQSKTKRQPGYKLPEASCFWVEVPPNTHIRHGSRFRIPLLNREIYLAAEANKNVKGAVSKSGGTATVINVIGEDIN